MRLITLKPATSHSGEEVRLDIYLQEASEKLYIKSRPMVLICPGGGYEWTSDREADPIAFEFLAMGYHAAVLRYSVAPARYPTALQELAFSVAHIRENAKAYHVDAENIYVLGCSAGGHLAATLGIKWNDPELLDAIDKESDAVKPNGLILCYPVITSGEFAHHGSFRNLLGDQYEACHERLSIEKQIGEQMPPAFIWHTYADESVPVENSLLLADALRKNHIPFEMHLFEKGEHGLSLANKLTAEPAGDRLEESCMPWIDLCHTWLKGKCGF
ncbi:MAG: alpha/beta hydrolase [Clostridia bacterium]|nr:alpha/beta hydrolase [Clostridia bacterium]